MGAGGGSIEVGIGDGTPEPGRADVGGRLEGARIDGGLMIGGTLGGETAVTGRLEAGSGAGRLEMGLFGAGRLEMGLLGAARLEAGWLGAGLLETGRLEGAALEGGVLEGLVAGGALLEGDSGRTLGLFVSGKSTLITSAMAAVVLLTAPCSLFTSCKSASV